MESCLSVEPVMDETKKDKQKESKKGVRHMVR